MNDIPVTFDDKGQILEYLSRFKDLRQNVFKLNKMILKNENLNKNSRVFRDVMAKIKSMEDVFSELVRRLNLSDSDAFETLILELELFYPDLTKTLNSLTLIFNQVSELQGDTYVVVDNNFDLFIENLKSFAMLLDEISNTKSVLDFHALGFYSISAFSPAINTPEYIAWKMYLTTAKFADLNSSEFIELKDKIDFLAQFLFEQNKFNSPREAYPYIAIIGPSFMGKTQTAFNLARLRPVFYANFFSTLEGIQDIYKAFVDISYVFKTCLADDLATFTSMNKGIETYSLLETKSVKLKTIGLIWRLIEISKEYDWKGSETWFEFYVKKRAISFEPLSLSTFWDRIENSGTDIIKKLPIIFIDEFDPMQLSSITLLRNLSRVMVLPCVLSSTNSVINNMIGSSSNSSFSVNFVWVFLVRKLMKANIAAITGTIGIQNFFVNNNSIDVTSLLREFNIAHNEANVRILSKISDFLLDQAKTSLQGTSAYVFQFFSNELYKQKNGNLDPFAIWNAMCLELIDVFRLRKGVAFDINGIYYGLRMFDVNEKLVASSQANGYEVTEQDVTRSIDHHFYYFGPNTPECVLPFKLSSNGKKLVLNLIPSSYSASSLPYSSGSIPYDMTSYYSLLEDDFFTTVALWTFRLKDPSVAAVISKNRRLVDYFSPRNDNALSNDFRIQEAMTYFAIGASSHQSCLGLTRASDFLCHLIGHVQISKEFAPFASVNICKYLASFLERITISYLIPKKSEKLESMLTGICRLGLCTRTANKDGIDIAFDIDYFSKPSKAIVECKYTDAATDGGVLREYLNKAKRKRSPLTILICYKIDESLTIANCLVSNNSDIFKINVYTVFNGNMIALGEYEEDGDVSGVFIIIHSNFQVSKI